MQSITSICLLAAATFLPSALAVPSLQSRDNRVFVNPGPPSKNHITKDNTVNGTLPANNGAQVKMASSAAIANLPIRITNNFNGKQLYAYVTGNDPNGRVVMLQPNNQWYYPTSSSSTVPQPVQGNVQLTVGAKNTTSSWSLPTYLISGRIYISEGPLTFSALQSGNSVTLVQPDFNNPSDSSANKNWGFVELTNTEGGLFVNLSFVDFVGLPLGITMTYTNGQNNTVRGVNSNAVATICSALNKYAGPDGAPWDQLCQYLNNGVPLRAVAPQKYIAVHNKAFENYYTDYVNSVWNKYASQPLTIDSQGQSGRFTCSTSSGNLTCNGGNRAFSKPSASNIFGCDGTFGRYLGDNDTVLAATARICAAFDRTTLLLNGGNVQPSLGPSNYYTTSPTNRYAQLVHSVELDGRGYAFPYDDVNPSGATDQSGTLASNQAAALTVTVGGA